MPSFNSKLVRLKANASMGLLIPYHRFNSKLVRLKGVRLEKEIGDLILFQFQTGAIKRPQHFDQHGDENDGFQFQTGAIKSQCQIRKLG